MYDKKLKYKILSIFAATVMTFTAITPVWAEEENLEADASGETSSDTSEENAAPEIAGLTYESAMDLSFAECFDVYYYNDGYKLLDIHDDARYLIVPEGKEAPDDLDPEIQILQQPHGSHFPNGIVRCNRKCRLHQAVRSRCFRLVYPVSS